MHKRQRKKKEELEIVRRVDGHVVESVLIRKDENDPLFPLQLFGFDVFEAPQIKGEDTENET